MEKRRQGVEARRFGERQSQETLRVGAAEVERRRQVLQRVLGSSRARVGASGFARGGSFQGVDLDSILQSITERERIRGATLRTASEQRRRGRRASRAASFGIANSLLAPLASFVPGIQGLFPDTPPGQV